MPTAHPQAMTVFSEAYISSPGPLFDIAVGNGLSCQVRHENAYGGQFYPPSNSPADCGTFLVVDNALYAPGSLSWAAFSIGPHTPFTPVSQTIGGSGVGGNPYQIITVVDAGSTGLRITQTDSYVVGDDFFTTEVSIENTGLAMHDLVLYRAGDCYLSDADNGDGLTDISAAGSVACIDNLDFVEWIPLSADSQYYEEIYYDVWSHIGTHQPFDSTCACGITLDNGAGLSWEFTIAAGATVTRSNELKVSIPSLPPDPPIQPIFAYVAKIVQVLPNAQPSLVGSLPTGCRFAATTNFGIVRCSPLEPGVGRWYCVVPGLIATSTGGVVTGTTECRNGPPVVAVAAFPFSPVAWNFDISGVWDFPWICQAEFSPGSTGSVLCDAPDP